MQLKPVFAGLLGAAILCAQAPEVSRAQARLERVRELAEAGAVPRVDVEKAESQLADAREEAFLRQALFSNDLTPQQAAEIVAVTAGRLERRQRALDERRKLLDTGIIARSELEPLAQDLERARQEHRLALSRASLARQLEEMARLEARAEALARAAPSGASARYDGDGLFSDKVFRSVEAAFARHFDRTLPVSAFGETAAHRALGFDHRGRVDVAINPDQPEGVWLRRYLESRHIPYFAFRTPVPGKATGPHIHLGPLSTRLQRA